MLCIPVYIWLDPEILMSVLGCARKCRHKGDAMITKYLAAAVEHDLAEKMVFVWRAPAGRQDNACPGAAWGPDLSGPSRCERLWQRPARNPSSAVRRVLSREEAAVASADRRNDERRLVELIGIEPTTCTLRTYRSSQLSYSPTLGRPITVSADLRMSTRKATWAAPRSPVGGRLSVNGDRW